MPRSNHDGPGEARSGKADALRRALRRARSKPAPKLLAAYAAGLLTVAVAALAVVELGAFNVAASRPHAPLVYWATTTTMVRSVRWRALSIQPPARFSQAQQLAGFRLYEQNCVACHGAVGVAQAPPADGMMPPPPYLIDSARKWTPAELYWIIRNGVTMTGMPAWDQRLSAPETWELVAFLQLMPRLNAADYRRMRETLASAGPG